MSALGKIYEDGQPVVTMVLLTDLQELAMKHDLIDSSQMYLFSQIHLLLAEIALAKEKDRS